MKSKYISFLIVLVEVSLFSMPIHAQDGMHLFGTITGTDENNKIYNAKGIGDFNGDGFDDFIASFVGKDTMIYSKSYAIPHSNLYFGSSDFDTIPEYTFTSSYAYPIGDVNNDGYDDLMINYKNFSHNPPYSTFKIYKGGKEIDTVPIFTYTPPYLWDMTFTNRIETIGDLNGDGYRDFIISSPYNWGDERGKVYVFYGGDSISSEPVKILTQGNPLTSWNLNFGITVTGIGDINNDNYDDMLIYQDPKDPDSGKVFLYYGCADLDTMHSKLFPSDGQWFGIEIQNTGDINGDGKYEFIIGSTTGTHIYFNEDSLIINHNVIGYYGAGGDINGDGYDDLLVSNPEYKSFNDSIIGIIYGLYGSSKIDTTIDFRIYGEQPYSSFGYSPLFCAVNISGDVNNDGYDEVLITAPAYRVDEKPVGKIYFYSYKNISSVETHNHYKQESFQLMQNFPNPFNPSTIISYRLSFPALVKIKIYDILGKEIALINDGIKPPGAYNFTFNSGEYNLSSGTYFIEFIAEPLNNSNNKYRKVIKALLLK